MQPYRLEIDPSDVEDLRDRLARTRWPEQLPGAGDWSKGVPVAEARAWARELAEFDWRALQAELDALPQWTTEIDGATVHFLHVRSDRADAIPLLVLHGWPGTVVELVDLVAPLTAPESGTDPAFHVVVPSHPGTGLSGGRSHPDGASRARRAPTPR